MAIGYVNISDYKLEVSAATSGSITYTEVKGVVGISPSTNDRSKSVLHLGGGSWMHTVKELQGLTLNVQLNHLVESTDDTLDPGQTILATAATKTGEAGNVAVKITHANGHRATTFVANVQNGNQGIGSGGSDGAFVTASYDLVSFGAITTADV